jgi:hypothetical protein
MLEQIVQKSTDGFPHPINAASKSPMTFREILTRLAAKHSRHPVFLPIPWRVLWMTLRTSEFLRLGLRFRSDSLLSLVNQNPAPDFTELDRLGFEFCDFA